MARAVTPTRVLANTDDATFRQWATDVSTMLRACLTQTSDTGQVDWTTGTQTRPAGGVYGYYEMYRFTDAMQSTRPIFIKIEYGSGSNPLIPTLRMSIASGSNGAGTLTGFAYITNLTNNLNVVSGGNVTSWCCYKDGYLGLLLWGTPTPTIGFPHLGFVFDRSRDTAGAPTANGFYYIYHAGVSSTVQAGGYSHDKGSFYSPPTGGFCLLPSYTDASSVTAKTKIYPHRMMLPDDYASTGIVSYLRTEVSPYTEFDVAPLPGLAAYRYLACDGYLQGANALQNLSYAGAMRYEA